MKPSLLIILGVSLVTMTTFAQQGSQAIIKQRAKDQVNQSNVRQGIAAPVTPPPPPAAAAPPAQNQSLTRLQSALAAFHATGSFSAEQKQKFANDVMAASLSAKPTPAATSKLADDMAIALTGRSLSSTSRSRLATELDAVLNPSKYPQAKMQAIFDDILAIFQDAGADRKQAVAVVDAAKALGAH
jgi:hypothetical protein